MRKLADRVVVVFDALNAKIADAESSTSTQKKLGSMTFKDIIAFQIAGDINQWLHDKGDDVAKYQIFLDRVMDLTDVVKSAISKVEETWSNIDG